MTTTDEISDAIATIGGKQEFAVEESGPADALDMRVRGVGRVRFPITDRIAKQLLAVARRAPFGVKSETRFDERVRNSWEIPTDEITLGGSFQRALGPHVDSVRRRLGLAPGGRVREVLDKLLIYGPGQFFAPHQDSERADGMLATLVVVLPSVHRGGAFAVEHGDQRVVVAHGPSSELRFVAFYADCRHEIEHVKSGHRVVLTYHLICDALLDERPRRERISGIDRLAQALEIHFSSRAPARFGRAEQGATHDRLVYLLDHEYTQRGLSFRRLKGLDMPRVSALLEVADRLDYDAYLALADVHEQWSCEDDGGGDRYGGWRDDDRGPEKHDLVELCDSDVQLRHWVGRDGAVDVGVASAVDDAEICWTRPSADMSPFRLEHEGYMGNYGNTVDRWYHRAALVLWPRSRAFIVRAKASPAWAFDQLERLLNADSRETARDNAKRMLAFWDQRAASDLGSSVVNRIFRVGTGLDDPELALELLGPLGHHVIAAATLSSLLAGAEHYGSAWSKRLFLKWAEFGHRRFAPLLPVLPLLTRGLAGHRWDQARELGEHLLVQEVEAFRKRCADAKSAHGMRDAAPIGAGIARDAVALVEAAAALASERRGAELAALLVESEANLPARVLVEVIETALEKRPAAEVRGLGLGLVHEHAVRKVRSSLARSQRDSNDWSLDVSLDCTCPLCVRLAAFLRDPVTRELPWPLAKERRAHVHAVIDRFDLPVAHDTIRKGSPYTLMLEKQAILFTREAEARKLETKLLARLECVKDALSLPKEASPREAGRSEGRRSRGTTTARVRTAPKA